MAPLIENKYGSHEKKAMAIRKWPSAPHFLDQASSWHKLHFDVVDELKVSPLSVK